MQALTLWMEDARRVDRRLEIVGVARIGDRERTGARIDEVHPVGARQDSPTADFTESGR